VGNEMKMVNGRLRRAEDLASSVDFEREHYVIKSSKESSRDKLFR